MSKLIHSFQKHATNLPLFLEEIDKHGGWPEGYKYVSFFHGDERVCEFGNTYLREPYWTTICSVDDYYWWKLSDERKEEEAQRVRKDFANQIRGMI